MLALFVFFARGALSVWHFTTGHVRIVSKLQNRCWALSRWMTGIFSRKKKHEKQKARLKMKLQVGNIVYCVFEKRVKPVDAQVARIVEVRRSRGNGLNEIVLDNGIMFRGSNAKDTFLFEDKERLSGAPCKPTRTNVVIFADRHLVVRHLTGRGATNLIAKLQEPPVSDAKVDADTEATESSDEAPATV